MALCQTFAVRGRTSSAREFTPTYYLTVTESKKFTEEDGTFHFKKHKIYLYKEDFNEFKNILDEMTDYIISEKGEEVISERHQKDYKPTQEKENKKSSEKDSDLSDIEYDE
mgnify:CR=1 FL=1